MLFCDRQFKLPTARKIKIYSSQVGRYKIIIIVPNDVTILFIAECFLTVLEVSLKKKNGI